MTTPSEDEGLRIIQPDKPKPRLLETAATKTKPETPEVITSSGIRRLKFLGLFAMLTIVFVIGAVFFLERQQRSWVGIRIGKATSAPVKPIIIGGVALTRLTPEMLRVTSIALGDPALAVVNGQQVAKGESFTLKTTTGAIELMVTNIEDRLVQFDYRGQKIEAKLPPELATKSPR